ncbi:hypothetical protein IGI04_034528 [Brassica rapa subsp. trilocularis]|uniref:Uncharacterized protein n=1 Tax=Brassica rapa subsp. trilocularis TaxID=1813537 RepID=A0ABQ7L8Z7_BRACM|nr:hypothetical protein IGI04_034528 [Brassica rapa subsp. trilocularis]
MNFWGKSFAAVETEHEVPSQTYLPETYHETQSRAQKRLFKEDTAVSVSSSAYCLQTWLMKSWLCDLSVINGQDSPRRLCTVEDRYPVRS